MTTTSTVLEVWKQREAWDLESVAGKKRQARARLIALWLGVAGALLGTSAGLVPAGAPGPAGATGPVLGVLSALAIALGGYFGRELLTPERETEWARARILAEALTRECLRYMMQVRPYGGADRAAILRTRSAALIANVGLERGPVPADDEVVMPELDSIAAYIAERPVKQAQWYEKRSREHRDELRKYRRRTFALGAAAVVVSVVGTTVMPLLALIPVITTATAALVAWIQSNRIGALVSLYQETATQLRLQVATWNDASAERATWGADEQRAAESALVERCEEIMAQENGAWQAEWLSEEKAHEALAAFESVTEEADKAAAGG